MTASILRHRPTRGTSPSPCRGANCSRPAGAPPTRGATTSDVSPDRTPPWRPWSRDCSSRSAHRADQHTTPHDPEVRREVRCTSSRLHDHGRRAPPRARNARPLVSTARGGSPPFAGDERHFAAEPRSTRPPPRTSLERAALSQTSAPLTEAAPPALRTSSFTGRQTVSDRHRATASTRGRSQRVRPTQREGPAGKTVRLGWQSPRRRHGVSAPAPTTRRRCRSGKDHRSHRPTRPRR